MITYALARKVQRIRSQRSNLASAICSQLAGDSAFYVQPGGPRRPLQAACVCKSRSVPLPALLQRLTGVRQARTAPLSRGDVLQPLPCRRTRGAALRSWRPPCAFRACSWWPQPRRRQSWTPSWCWQRQRQSRQR